MLKIDYAKIKGVSPSYITKLIAKGKLRTKQSKTSNRIEIIDCKSNDKIFDNPSFNAKRNKSIKNK